jgi:hypothetical protein
LGCRVILLGAISEEHTASTFYPEGGIDLLDYTALHPQPFFAIVLIFIQGGSFKRRRHYSSSGDAKKVLQHLDIAEHVHL